MNNFDFIVSSLFFHYIDILDKLVEKIDMKTVFTNLKKYMENFTYFND